MHLDVVFFLQKSYILVIFVFVKKKSYVSVQVFWKRYLLKMNFMHKTKMQFYFD